MQVHTRGLLTVQSAAHCIRSPCVSCRHLQTNAGWPTAFVQCDAVSKILAYGRRCGSGGRRTFQQSVRTSAIAAEEPQTESPDLGIQTTLETLPRGVRLMTVTVPPTLLQKIEQKELKYFRGKVEVPGFRKGKRIPDDIMVEHIGEKKLKTCIVAGILDDYLPEALARYEGELLTESMTLVEDSDPMAARLDVTQDFTFQIRFEVLEPLRWKRPYRSLEVEVEVPGPEEVEREVERVMLTGRKQGGTLTVADRPLQAGDVGIVDFAIRRPGNGEVVAGSERSRMRLDTDSDDAGLQLPGLVKGLEGMRVGEKRTLELSVEGAWWEPSSLEATPCLVDVTLHELFTLDLPEETDEWADQQYSKGGGLAGLRARLRQLVESQVEVVREEAVDNAVLAALADMVEAELPPTYFDQLAQSLYAKELLVAQSNGGLSKEQVKEMASEELFNAFIDSKREYIEAMGRATLAMDDIYEQEGLHVDQAMVEAAIQEKREEGTQVDEEGLAEAVAENVRMRQVMNWISENCKVQQVPRKLS